MGAHESALTARFGRFTLNARRRELLADGEPVPIGGRAFEILVVLVEAGGQLVTKDELLSRVWPGRFVEENSLQFQISTVRKALAGDRDFIKTIPGRGYCFVADVSTHGVPDVVPVIPSGEAPLSISFPAAMSHLTGQAATSTRCSDLVAALQLAARVDASDIVETRPGTESRRRLPPEIAQAWIATLGPPSPREFGFPAAAAMFQLADDGSATHDSAGAGPAPTRLFLLLSIEPVALWRQEYVAGLNFQVSFEAAVFRDFQRESGTREARAPLLRAAPKNQRTRHRNADTGQATAWRRREIGHRDRGAGRVLRIMSGLDVHHQRAIFRRPAHRSKVIERIR
jgi:DNA-binding winged helix-turn-helix (wHTH) protein